MLLVSHDNGPRGYLSVGDAPMPHAMIARKCGCDVEEFERLLAELVAAGVPSRTRHNVLYSRRMVRDSEEQIDLSRKRAEAGRLGAERRWNEGAAHGKPHGKLMASAMAKHGSSSSSSPSNSIPPYPQGGGGGLNGFGPGGNSLKDPHRLRRWLTERGPKVGIADNRENLLHVLAAAERANEIGDDPPKLFAWLVRQGIDGDWSQVSGEQMDRAKTKLLGMEANGSTAAAADLARKLTEPTVER